jgi:dTDP-glucose 4,6-dehydratase
MRILVTGGAGFQGSHLVEACLSAGHQITVLNTFSPRALKNIEAFVDRTAVVWGSVTDPEIVEKTVRGHEVVFHLAGRIHVDESIDTPVSYLNTNVLGTYNILQAIRKEKARLIFSSSVEVYGASDGEVLTETSPLRPHSPYAASKAAADRLCHAYWTTYGLDVCIVRPCNIYGPRQKAGKGGAVIPIFVEQALAGKPLLVYGTGQQRREYMHVSDLVKAYLLLLERDDVKGETINVGSGERIAIGAIADFIADKLRTSVEHGPARAGEVSEFSLDSSKIKALGFKHEMPFWRGLEAYVKCQSSGVALSS